MSTDPNTSASWQPEPTTPAGAGPDSTAVNPRHRQGADPALSTNLPARVTSGAAQDPATNKAAVVLSAERAHISTVRRPTHRVRVRREILTEEVTLRVTVRREVLHVEQTPIDAASTADVPLALDASTDAPFDQMSDGARPSPGLLPTGSSSLEVVLSQEVPVVSVRTVPYERVRLTVHPVVTTTTVDVDVRREVADVTSSAQPPGTGRDGPATT